MITLGRSALLGILVVVAAPWLARCEPIRIGAEQSYARILAVGTVDTSTGGRPIERRSISIRRGSAGPTGLTGLSNWSSELHTFRLQISSQPDCSEPVVDVACAMNFYNCLPALTEAAAMVLAGGL